MTIIITVTQICNGCGDSRRLDKVPNHPADANVGGWREVKPKADLCPRCIEKALAQIEKNANPLTTNRK